MECKNIDQTNVSNALWKSEGKTYGYKVCGNRMLRPILHQCHVIPTEPTFRRLIGGILTDLNGQTFSLNLTFIPAFLSTKKPCAHGMAKHPQVSLR